MNRRDFLRNAAAAGCCLAAHGLAPTLQTAQAAANGPAPHSPLTVIAHSVSTDTNPRARAWPYITEILRRAGLFFQSLAPNQVDSLLRRPPAIVLLAGNLPLTSPQREALTQWVKNGGLLLGLGGTSGLDEVFGVQGGSPLAEGWINITAADHPVTSGLRSSLHVFGGYAMKKGAATSLADLQGGNNAPRGSAILENRFGQGRALLLSPDLLFSIVHIQQGVRVLQDGKPAPDGSALINEGLLKAEDGLVLDWTRDRTATPPDNGPLFLEPITDELRELILRGIFHLASQQGLALPVLWYWPRSLKAVALMSHDSDGNQPPKAPALLEVLNRCKIKSSWCILYPGGYPREFYRTLADADFEIALHYDAMTGKPQTSWSKENFLLQHQWLLKEAGLKHITSNKNHYTRWEGRLDFFRWCEEVGIGADQTRGPSKKGTIGFPLGGSQPYFPLDDETESPRFLKVLEINLMTQDLIVTCPPDYGKPLLDSALRHHGVAHFLFHPAHILEPGVADALSGLVDYGKTRGLEWWTSRQILQWESARRDVQARFDSACNFSLRPAAPLAEATLLLLRAGPEPRRILLDGQPAQTTPWTLYGFGFDAVQTNLSTRVKVQVA